MIGLIAKKVGMTQLFDPEGHQVPVTVLETGPCFVTSIRTKEKNGYSAVQLAFDRAKEKRLTRAELGQFKKFGTTAMKCVREIRTEELENLSVGTELRVENFEEGDFVDVEGVSIGKGFQGVVKRHKYRGGEKAHGTKMGREPGSIGSKAGGVGCRKKVRKGKKLPGHMGHERITVQSLRVVRVDSQNHLLAVRGAVPGVEGSYLVVRSALKRGKARNRKWKVASPAGKTSQESVSGETQQRSEEPKKP